MNDDFGMMGWAALLVGGLLFAAAFFLVPWALAIFALAVQP